MFKCLVGNVSSINTDRSSVNVHLMIYDECVARTKRFLVMTGRHFIPLHRFQWINYKILICSEFLASV